MDGVAKLIKESYRTDDIGVSIPEETEREIFVSEQSITRQEWLAAGRQGLNPSVVLITPYINYDGEKVAEYGGKRYGIYRTYQDGENIELYLEEKGGTNG